MSARTSLDAAADLLGPLAQRDAPLGALTTYRVGGPAALLVRPAAPADLDAVAAAVARTGVDVLVLGRGSNLLVADAGFPGLVVALGGTFAEHRLGPATRAGAGVALPVLARQSAAAGLRGFEWAVGVPGSIGGAVRMNAGGHGSDVAASLLRVRVLDLRTGDHGWVGAPELQLGYRSSALRDGQVVVEAELALEPGDPAEAEAVLADVVRWRREHQPGGQNAGSVFANPAGDAAGRLVEAAGCRGLRLGSAQVSPKHANFVQADEGGSADDVAALLALVRRRVHDRSGVLLRPELRLVGFPPDVLDSPRAAAS